MRSSRSQLAQQGIQAALSIRQMVKADLHSPVCIYDLCAKLGVAVRFVDINMEGMYLHQATPTIFVGSKRPLPRRNYTCGHELGHHVFSHGSTIDELQENISSRAFQPEEFLADTFAAALLMPLVGLRRSFTLGGIKPADATPVQLYTIACQFGVGYETLVNHLAFGAKLISPERAKDLGRVSPKQIRSQLLGREVAEPLVVVDGHWTAPTVDLEVGSYLLVPTSTVPEGANLARCEDLGSTTLFQAAKPGLVRLIDAARQESVFARISRFHFVGLSQYRHLEEVEDE